MQRAAPPISTITLKTARERGTQSASGPSVEPETKHETYTQRADRAVHGEHAGPVWPVPPACQEPREDEERRKEKKGRKREREKAGPVQQDGGNGALGEIWL